MTLILPKTAGEGIKVELAAPTYPWFDKEGLELFNSGGAGAPTIAAFRGGSCRALQFGLNDRLDYRIHVPHDLVPLSDVFIHIHWMHNGTAITGNAGFTLAYTYAKGHNQSDFSVEKSQIITYTTGNITTTPQYRHRIDEVQLSNSTGSGNFLDSTLLEVDGMIHVSCTLTTLPTITAGSLFISEIDLHYQSTGIGTKQKSPPFYT
jgi:hypothetical protein